MPLNTIPNKGLTSRGYPSDRIVTPLIINGDMSVAQRGTSTASITGNGYAIDRFRHQITNGGTWTISQSTDVPTGQGFAYSQKWDCTTADTSLDASDRLRMMQRIEGNMLQSLKYGTSSAESITISFWVKSNKTGTYSWSARDSGNTKVISATYTIDSANTWEKKILSFAGTNSPSISINNTAFLALSWWLGAGTTYTSGSSRSTWTTLDTGDEAAGQTVNLADSTSNEFYVTGVQLEVGEFDSTTIPSFPFENFESNLRKCMRYFQIYMNAESANKDFLGGHIHDNDTFRMSLIFPVEFRTTPSLSSSSSGSADHWRIVTSSINTNYGSAITFTGSTKSGQFTLVDTGGTDMSSHVDDPGYMQNNQSSCYLKMDAEL